MGYKRIYVVGLPLVRRVALGANVPASVSLKTAKPEAIELGRKAAKEYEYQVWRHLGTIAGTLTGQVILQAIERSSQDLYIVPRMSWGNADAEPDEAKDSTQKDYLLFERADRESTWINESFFPTMDGDKPVLGTGAGTSVQLHFTPRLPSFPNIPRSKTFRGRGKTLPGDADDQTLLHEMVHAYRQLTGSQTSIPLSGRAQTYDNPEEFLAVLVTNLHMSERGWTNLRADHRSFRPLPTNLVKPGGFFGDPLDGPWNRLALWLTRLDPVIFAQLVKVYAASFNPFRDLWVEAKMQDAMRFAQSFNGASRARFCGF